MQVTERAKCMLPNRVEAERMARGWSKSELCRQAGISRPTLYTVERHEPVNMTVMLALARALDVDWRVLWDGVAA